MAETKQNRKGNSELKDPAELKRMFSMKKCGATHQEIADLYGVTDSTICVALKRYAKTIGETVPTSHHRLSSQNTDRLNDILAMRDSGATYKAIASKYGISYQRVGQILEAYRKSS